MIEVRRPMVADLKMVAGDIRAEDLREWYSGTGIDALDGMTYSVAFGKLVRAAYSEDGTPLCFWGCDGGNVWLFATNAAARRAFSLHKVLAPNLKELTDTWPLLKALAHSDNTVHHRWLEWLGFELVEEVEAGPFRENFKMYVRDVD